jgi:hypothetical protein
LATAENVGEQATAARPDEQSFVSVACGIPNKLSTEKQCARLLQIKDRMEEEGFTAV